MDSSLAHETPFAFARRTRRRSPESQALLRDEMIAHAKAIFRAKGYEAVSVRAVTNACGISTMSFYSYFDSKQDLARHILVDFFEAMLEGLQTVDAQTPQQALEAHVLTCIEHCESSPDCFRMAFAPLVEGQGEAPIRFDDLPVYRRIAELGHERLLDCVRVAGRTIDERAGALLYELMLAKTVGYLCLSIFANRAARPTHDALRQVVVRDIADMTRHAGLI